MQCPFRTAEDLCLQFLQLLHSPRLVKSPQREGRGIKGKLDFSHATTPAFPGVDFLNILAKGVSKGKALHALTKHLGITPAEVIAIGDGANDIPLLSAVGLAVAMGNASEAVKAVADHITLDVEHGGLAKAIEKFLL